ncbi:MAG: helix-turn-helix domain-containing protein [Candidatus Rokuibacteriota bacterium]
MLRESVLPHGDLHVGRKELHRPGLLKAAITGRLTNAQVATALRITVRQVRRLKRRFEAGGAPALCHRSRGRPSPRQLPAAVREHVIRADDHRL